MTAIVIMLVVVLFLYIFLLLLALHYLSKQDEERRNQYCIAEQRIETLLNEIAHLKKQLNQKEKKDELS